MTEINLRALWYSQLVADIFFIALFATFGLLLPLPSLEEELFGE
jgi:hypothetical protein